MAKKISPEDKLRNLINDEPSTDIIEAMRLLLSEYLSDNGRTDFYHLVQKMAKGDVAFQELLDKLL